MAEDDDAYHRRPINGRNRTAVTLDAILTAAANLLIEQGLPGFNTNAVAKAAKVNVATLYHHFPNKVAILRELYERNTEAATDWSRAQLDDLASTEDLPSWLRRMSSQLLEFRRHEVAGSELRRACRAIPELIAVEQGRTLATADLVAVALTRRYPRLPRDRVITAARLLVYVTTGMLDLALETREESDRLAEEVERMIGGYFVELTKL
jgi:AcrR family transcriptional regulator